MSLIYPEGVDNPTRYERMVATPDDSSLHSMWIGWAIVSFSSALASSVILLAIGLAPALSRTIFNIYLASMVFPDFVFGVGCGITCTVNAIAPHLGSNSVSWMCEVQSIYCVFAFVASPWMNAVTGREVNRLLEANKWARGYVPPSRREAGITIACVYTWAVFVALWTLIPGLPHRAAPIQGEACLPVDYDIASTIFLWVVFAPAFLFIPFAYMIVISGLALKRGTLDGVSHARSLAFFFLRIWLVFLLFWAPTVLLIYMTPSENAWVAWAGGFWSHLQGIASALICLTKPDVYTAVTDLPRQITLRCSRVCCCYKRMLLSARQVWPVTITVNSSARPLSRRKSAILETEVFGLASRDPQIGQSSPVESTNVHSTFSSYANPSCRDVAQATPSRLWHELRLSNRVSIGETGIPSTTSVPEHAATSCS